MQLNVYVPKSRAFLIERLDETARRTGRQKNELVLEALAAYLVRERPKPGLHDLGKIEMPSREELYGEYLDRRWGRG